jgi:hypothetical protein
MKHTIFSCFLFHYCYIISTIKTPYYREIRSVQILASIQTVDFGIFGIWLSVMIIIIFLDIMLLWELLPT